MWEYAVVLGAVQALFFAMFFFGREFRRRFRSETSASGQWRPGNIYLGLFFLTAGGSIVMDYMYGSRAVLEWPHLSRLGFPITALNGVFYFLAVNAGLATIDRERKLSRTARALLFLPPLLFTAYLLPYYFSPAAEKLKYIQDDFKQLHLDCEIMYWFSLLYFLGLLALSIHALHKYHKDARDKTRAYLGVWLGITAGLIVFQFVWFGLYLIDENMINKGVVGIVASVMMLFLAANRIYFGGDDALTAWQPPEPNYKKSLLSDADLDALGIQTVRYLDGNRDYLQAEFRSANLAQGIGVSPHTLSQVLSRNFNKSFHELMNEYRVAEAARRLRDPEYSDYTILRIALDCGFNSKSTFNHAFRRITGRTPSDFRRKKGPVPLARSTRTS